MALRASTDTEATTMAAAVAVDILAVEVAILAAAVATLAVAARIARTRTVASYATRLSQTTAERTVARPARHRP